MTQVTFKGNPVKTVGQLPEVGQMAPNFIGVKNDLSEARLDDYRGQKVILNIFPSLDTDVCAASVRRFNEEASKLDNTAVLCVSMDLPFAQARFCATENLKDVVPLSVFRNPQFGKDYGVAIVDGPLAGLNSRAIVVVDENGKVIYNQQVSEVTDEPDYEKALAVL